MSLCGAGPPGTVKLGSLDRGPLVGVLTAAGGVVDVVGVVDAGAAAVAVWTVRPPLGASATPGALSGAAARGDAERDRAGANDRDEGLQLHRAPQRNRAATTCTPTLGSVDDLRF